MISEIVEKYLDLFPADKQQLTILAQQIKNGEKLDGRTNFKGHITGGAIVFSPDFKKLLLIKHPSSGSWWQPGGHWDENEQGPWQAAKREAAEETGVRISKMLPLPNRRVPIQINSHQIPASPVKNEPEHFHHDFRYVFLAASDSLSLNDHVIKEAAWTKLEDLSDERLKIAVMRAKELHLLKA